jgi:hypothetical protein
VPEYEAPALEQVPQPGFAQSALMSVLSSIPMFMPERGPTDRLGRPGKYPSRFDRFAGVAGPLLARGVAGGIEGGLKARQATVNAKNAAATNEARMKYQSEALGYPSKVGAAATMGAAKLRASAPAKPATIEDWQRTPDEQKKILDFKKSVHSITGSDGAPGLTFEQHKELAELRGENPKLSNRLRVIELQDKKRRSPLERQLQNLTQWGEPTLPKKVAAVNSIRDALSKLDVEFAEKSEAVLNEYLSKDEAPKASGSAKIVNGVLVRSK